MPSVPSAPINNFVVSNPADDFLARRRVLMTCPEGRTTVYDEKGSAKVYQHELLNSPTRLRNHSALAVPYLTALAVEVRTNGIDGIDGTRS